MCVTDVKNKTVNIFLHLPVEDHFKNPNFTNSNVCMNSRPLNSKTLQSINVPITSINRLSFIVANDLTNLYEGDISLQGEVPKSNDPSLEAEEVSNFIEAKRDAVRNREYLWQSKVVPYEIASALGE